MLEPLMHKVWRSCLDPLETEKKQPNLRVHSNHPHTTAALVNSLISQEAQEQSLRDYKVTIEYKHLKSHAPGGVYLVPSLDSLRTFHGVIFVRRGPFTNGIFKFLLELPPQYNDLHQHPKITFLSPVYNPYVDPKTGILDIKTGA